MQHIHRYTNATLLIGNSLLIGVVIVIVLQVVIPLVIPLPFVGDDRLVRAIALSVAAVLILFFGVSTITDQKEYFVRPAFYGSCLATLFFFLS